MKWRTISIARRQIKNRMPYRRVLLGVMLFREYRVWKIYSLNVKMGPVRYNGAYSMYAR
jgi:hypothetical protein